MLNELVCIDSFGSAENLFKFYRIFDEKKLFILEDVKKYSKSMIKDQFYFNNTIWLLRTISLIDVERNFIKVNYIISDFKKFCDLVNEKIIEKLIEQYEIILFFNSSIKYNFNKEYYYLLFSDISFKYSSLRNILISTSFFTKMNEFLIINKATNDYFFEKYASERRKVSLEDLRKRLKNQEINGQLAEEFVLKYEIQRLKEHTSVGKIKLISAIDVAAGYDIISYKNLDSIVFDRFIEVKSYTTDKKFYWSKNEREKARKLRESYCIYLVNINKINEDGYVPEIIANPIEYFYDGNNFEWILQTDTILVTKI